MKPKLTDKQGQYLAYIYSYTKINGRPPAEADMQHYFKVSPPSVHQMVVKLESLGLTRRSRNQKGLQRQNAVGFMDRGVSDNDVGRDFWQRRRLGGPFPQS